MTTIDRDTYGIPHISGATEADAAFGFGFAQAQDHLDLMLRNYMEATGHLAEIDGEAAIETDVRTRLWRTAEQAATAYPQLDPLTRTYLDAFVAGINQYMEEHPDDVPSWAHRVTPDDILALYRLLHIRLNEWIMPELAEGTVAGMSNQWAVAPKKTATGVTICAMDPHVPWNSIFRMYEAHLSSNDGLNVYGGATLGLPTIILGHTGRHAWSLTINRCDISDRYIEQLDPQDNRQYKYQDDWRRVEEWETVIRVKTTGGFREERRMLAWTHHGPIVDVSGDTAYAIRMSAYEIVDPISPFLGMARANTLSAFKTALITIDIPMFNIVYGDVDGSLYYVYNERCPARSQDYDWRQPVPGWLHRTEWQMYLPFTHLPQIENPPSGFLQNCNNAPWYVTAGADIRQADYPPYAASGEMTGRGQRMFMWLLEHDRITVEEAFEIVTDEYNLTAEELKPKLLQSYEDLKDTVDDPDGYLAQAVGILRTWDNVGSVESHGMSIFALWKIHYDDLLQTQTRGPDSKDQTSLMVDALRQTADYMIEHYNRIEVPWGDIHVLKRGARTYPVGGSSPGTESLRTVRGGLDDEGKMIVDYGSAFTMVLELGNDVRAWSLVPFGSSERPDSPHYDDQAVLWTEKRLKRAWFTREEIEENRESSTQIQDARAMQN